MSNGDAVVQSAANGRYSLPIDVQRDRYVFITVPAGFRPQDRFYVLLDDAPPDKPVDFPLLAAPERARAEFRLAHLSDTHVVLDGSGAVSQDVLAQDLQQVAEASGAGLAVVTGDLTNMGTVEELEAYRAAIESAPIPVFSVFGGHDGNIERRGSDADEPCTRNFEATLGPPYYSFDWGGYHFVAYATEENYFAGGDRTRKERWLWADLAKQPSHRRSVLMLHTSPDRDLVERFGQHNGALVLHGHWHSSRVFTLGETTVASAPAACFGGIDTRPRGYREVAFSPQGIRTELCAHGRSATQSSQAHEATLASRETTAPTSIAVGKETHALAWRHDFSSPLHRAAPVGFADNVLVSLQSESHPGRNGVTCLDVSTGEARWHAPTPSAIKQSVAVAAASGQSEAADKQHWCAALTVTGELHLIALATGERAWSVQLPAYPLRWVCSAPACGETSIIAGSKAGYGAYDLTTGAQQWYFAPGEGDEWPSYIQPQLYNDELCIVLLQRRGILALGMDGGELVWEHNLPVEYFCASPVLAGDLVVASSASPHTGASLTGGRQGDLAVLDARSGAEVAHFAQALPVYATGLAVQDNHIYSVTAAGTAHCHDLRTGTELWRFQTGADLLDMTPYRRNSRSLLAAPVLVGGHVLVPACDGWLYVLDQAKGDCTDRAYFGAPLTAAPCVTPSGFCLGTYGGTLYSYSRSR